MQWLGPYEIETIYDNGFVCLYTVDFERKRLLLNGHKLKLYKKPLFKEALFLEVAKELTVVPFGILQE